MPRRLYTFVISHFSEKARFAFDLAGIEYEEQYLMPGPHALTTRRLAKRSSVPILVDGETVIQGSSAILDHAVERYGAKTLAPADPADAEKARELEALADDAFGKGVQTIFYEALLSRPADVVKLWTLHGPWWGPALLRVAFPIGRARVRRMYRIDVEGVAAAKQRFRAAVERTDRMIEGRRYFFGDTPTRADVTVASLLAPACAPENHVVPWPALPDEIAEFLAPMTAGPTFDFVRRIYREDRKKGPRAA